MSRKSTKRLKVAPTEQLGGLAPSRLIDWTKCCLCQQDKNENLVNPTRNKDVEQCNKGYKTLAENIEELHRLDELPSFMNFKGLDEGGGILSTFINREAKWHKSCSLNFNSNQLKRIHNRLLKSSAQYIPSSKASTSFTGDEGHYITRSAVPPINTFENICCLCRCGKLWNKPLHQVMTFEVETQLRSAATPETLAALGPRDFISQEIKYHKQCINKYMNTLRPRADTDQNKLLCEGIAFAELVSYIQGKLDTEGIDFIFKMSDLSRIYDDRINILLGVKDHDFVKCHTSRLRERIEAHFPQLISIKSGNGYQLVRDKINFLSYAEEENYDGDAVACMRFLRNLRKEISAQHVSFSGNFSKNCQKKSVSPALLAIVNMMIYGTSVEEKCSATQPALTISQLVLFNYHEKIPKGNLVRNKKNHEPPLPLYIGLLLYGKSRDKSTIDELHNLGISVSSNRIYEVTSSLCQLVVNRAAEEGIVCPSNLQNKVFTVAAYDNIDHNPSSSTSKGSFHGTSISVFQMPNSTNPGHMRTTKTSFIDVNKRSRRVPELPDNFSIVKPVILPCKQPGIPKCKIPGENMMPSFGLNNTFHNEDDWLEFIGKNHNNDSYEGCDLSWGAFHANSCTKNVCVAVNSLLPLFHEESSSVSMICHALNVVRSVTKLLNPGQTPVIWMDQPLYTAAKLIQWNWPQRYGENLYVIMFAPFHVEQAFLRVIGQLLDSSGWVEIIENSEIATAAFAESALRVTSVKKTRIILQKTAAVLYILLHEAYAEDNTGETIQHWVNKRESSSPTFKFWLLVLKLITLLLSFVRSIREANYDEFKESLKLMLPWFFVFNHTNYSRWLSVHLKDLEELSDTAIGVHDEFKKGNFVVRKTTRPFSALAVDQAHEQNNAIIKGDGGAVGLTEDPSALRRWSVAGPEVCRLLNEFGPVECESSDKHHEQYTAYQNMFRNDTCALKDSFCELGNPFLETTNDLIAIDSRLIVNKEGVDTLNSLEECANNMYETFVKERLTDKTKTIFEPLKKVNTKIFASKPTRSDHENKSKQTDEQLFSKLFIACQNREMNLDEFFSHENQSCPPSLSVNRKLLTGKKSDLVNILAELIEPDEFGGHCDGVVFDGAALIHNIKPNYSKTFAEYCKKEFQDVLLRNITSLSAKRIDLVWDRYIDHSLKSGTRQKRGSGTRRQVNPETKLPRNWPDFLLNGKNKKELFILLANYVLHNFSHVHVVTNVDTQIISSKDEDTLLNGVSCENMEEADGRLILHVRDMTCHGIKSVLLFSKDTDVVVLAISFFHRLKASGLKEFWILFGSGRNQRYLPIHQIAEKIGETKSIALRGFHAFSGCDTVSAFRNKGKLSAWKTWKAHEEVTSAFFAISNPLPTLQTDIKQLLERFVVILYCGVTAEFATVNESRKYLFATKAKPLTSLPPTSDALTLHTLRAMLQAGHIWGQADRTIPHIASPEHWGWIKRDSEWAPQWSTKPAVWEACRELLKCGCKEECKSNKCSCKSAGIPCTLMCTNCRGKCPNP